MLNLEEKTDVLARLKKIAGQAEGLAKMVQQERYCVDVLTQVAAVQSALAQVGKLVLRSHIASCFSHALRHGTDAERSQKIQELVEVVTRFGRTR